MGHDATKFHGADKSSKWVMTRLSSMALTGAPDGPWRYQVPWRRKELQVGHDATKFHGPDRSSKWVMTWLWVLSVTWCGVLILAVFNNVCIYDCVQTVWSGRLTVYLCLLKLDLLKHNSSYLQHPFDTRNLYTSPTKCICLRVHSMHVLSSRYLAVQHWPVAPLMGVDCVLCVVRNEFVLKKVFF